MSCLVCGSIGHSHDAIHEMGVDHFQFERA